MDENSRKEKLVDLLTMHKFKYKPIASNTRDIADPNEAVAFLFDVYVGKTQEPVTVVVSIDDENNLNVFFDSRAHESQKFKKFVPAVGRFAVMNELKPNFESLDLVQNYLKKRKKQMREKENEVALNEGYRAISSQRSQGDHVPSVKIIIEHNRKLAEGEQRFRSINRIFIENTLGERILTPVRETSLAKIFARVIAEGDLPHGVRWQHVEQLVEEFQKIRNFVRATKDQINEHELVSVGRSHYQTLRETLSRLAAHRGYNQYFENWQPNLNEDTPVDIAQLHEDGTDPRIVEAMPILYRLQRSQTRETVSESREVQALESWANSIIYGPIMEDEGRRGFMKKAGLGVAGLAGLAGLAKLGQMATGTDTEEIIEKDPTYQKHKAAAAVAKAAGDTVTQKKHEQEMAKIRARHEAGKGSKVDEDLDADQKRAGQLGPTEKVGPQGAVGKLVGASESAHSAPSLNVRESQEVDDILQLAKMIQK